MPRWFFEISSLCLNQNFCQINFASGETITIYTKKKLPRLSFFFRSAYFSMVGFKRNIGGRPPLPKVQYTASGLVTVASSVVSGFVRLGNERLNISGRKCNL